MSEVDKVPEWAIDQALERCGINPDQKPFTAWRNATYARAVELFAAHIAEHEEPPVEEAVMEAYEAALFVSTGSIPKPEKRHDRAAQARRFADELAKRGIELAGGAS